VTCFSFHCGSTTGWNWRAYISSFNRCYQRRHIFSLHKKFPFPFWRAMSMRSLAFITCGCSRACEWSYAGLVQMSLCKHLQPEYSPSHSWHLQVLTSVWMLAGHCYFALHLGLAQQLDESLLCSGEVWTSIIINADDQGTELDEYLFKPRYYEFETRSGLYSVNDEW
jgi:hypothetical protein